MSHPDATYWDKGMRNVPDMTGARNLLGAEDVAAVCQVLDIPLPMRSVVDVGCGTGRLARHCTQYCGLDIAPSAVEYCQAHGLKAFVIDGPKDIWQYAMTQAASHVCALSLLTHMGRAERWDYLHAFRRVATDLLVDIIPGDGTGDVALWTAVPEQFEDDLHAAGYEVLAEVDRHWDQEDNVHRFYHARHQ